MHDCHVLAELPVIRDHKDPSTYAVEDRMQRRPSSNLCINPFDLGENNCEYVTDSPVMAMTMSVGKINLSSAIYYHFVEFRM